MWFPLMLLAVAAVEDPRPVPAFQDVLVRGSFDVDVMAGDRAVIVVSDDPALVRTRVEKGQLILEGDAKGSVRVTAPTLSSVRVSGSGTVRVFGLKAKSFQIKHAGPGDVVVTGAADKLDVVLDGSGHVEARDVRAKSCTVLTNGDGLVEVTAEALVATVKGDGEVRFGGTPRVQKHITGSGSVEPLGTPTKRDRKSGRASSGGPSRSATSGAESRASENVRALDPLHR